MRLYPVHLEFWQAAKAYPAFASRIAVRPALPVNAAEERRRLIDRCVNAHQGPVWLAGRRLTQAANTCRLLQLAAARGDAGTMPGRW